MVDEIILMLRNILCIIKKCNIIELSEVLFWCLGFAVLVTCLVVLIYTNYSFKSMQTTTVDEGTLSIWEKWQFM